MTIRTSARRAVVAVTALSVLAACGGGTDDGHNAQDVAFTQGMISHHQQALEMARLASDRSSSAQVKDLAARIEKAQDPEITTMTGRLRAWGEDVTMAGMDHSGHTGSKEMSGMMSTADLAKLERVTGKDFDTMFLTMMTEHHRGAVEMAATEKSKGRDAAAMRTADDIVTAQNAEIKEMNRLLGGN
ncbi:DUF305 domain-containing protein [Streptomyces sp. NPDC086787]|uniref:DUF305 domain-containing protein n=1 Tax=Streptomyces sp. NPDC086787 TaxID=3365759 RepID=UPI00382975C4